MESDDGGDADDAAEPRLHHVGDGGFRDIEDAFEIDTDDIVPCLLRHFDEQPVAGDAGVVDKQVELAEFFDGLVDEIGRLGRVRDIRLERVDDASCFIGDFPGGFLRRLQLCRADGEIGALQGELACGFETDAAGGACDDGGLVLESHAFFLSLLIRYGGWSEALI